MQKIKPYSISQRVVIVAYEIVKANKLAYVIDEEFIEAFEEKLNSNLYKIWNEMSSGSYFPGLVRKITIPEKNGEVRTLEMPILGDQIAQMVAKLYFEPCVEQLFYYDFYGYRPNKSAIQATMTRGWRKDWVLEFAIKGIFDNLRHDYLLTMVEHHTKKSWILLYIKRWLVAPFLIEDGTIVPRNSGMPQGGVISPLLANLFLHYVFDDFMVKELTDISWARYANDGIVYCVSLNQAEYLQRILRERFESFGLELNLCCKEIHQEKSGEMVTQEPVKI